MQRLLIILLILVSMPTVGKAQHITLKFDDVPMPEALKQIAGQSQDYSIHFMYDELEDFRVTTTINGLSTSDAIRQAVGFYPIALRVDEEHHAIMLECLQASQRRYVGYVVDEQGEPLEYANVTLLYPKDSTFITGGISNQSGRFVIPCKHGDVLLKVSHAGYEPHYAICHQAQVGKVQLKNGANLMPMLTIKGKMISEDENGYTIGSTEWSIPTSDMLSTLPHISLKNSSYCIDGQPTTNIYIDGQLIHSLSELCHITSDMVSKVRIEYATRSIHITLRKPKSGGFYGSLDGMAEFLRHNGNSASSFGAVWYSRHGGLSIYDRYGSEMNEETCQFIYSPGSEDLIEGYIDPSSTQLANRISLTQQFNTRHSLGVSYYVARHKMNATSNSSSRMPYTSYYEGTNHYNDNEVTLNYDASLGRRDVELHVIGDYYSRATSTNNLNLYGAGVGTESGESPSIQMGRFSMEIARKATPRMKWRAGVDIRGFSSLYDPSHFVSNFQGVNTLTQQLKVEGMMPRAFAELQGLCHRLQWSAACHIQANLASYEYKGQHPQNWHQSSISPQVQLLYPFGRDNSHHATLRYRHELQDVPYAAMSPIVQWSDTYNYSVGTPALQAPSHHSLTLGASLWNDALNLSATYLHQHNEIFWQSYLSNDSRTLLHTSPTNLSHTQMLTFHAEGRWHPLDGWLLKAEGTIDLRPEDEVMQGNHYDELRWRHHYALLNDIHLSGDWSITLNFSIQPTYRIYNRTYHTLYDVRGEVSKTFLRKRLLCAIQFDALGNRRHLDRKIGDVTTCYRYTSPVQMVGFHLTWLFSGGRHVKVGTTEGGQQYQEMRDR